ncbi:ABC transporter permease [Hymenobacter aquaticus]|uniref:ABC transporter permease n=1 Tax=Hymenobacter aquaticus TaxID=1867101 RepID=A0A4Z0Q684_9BACT|nr:ABC transporter permease [Hymenobacter aquaticus]TGE25597.1 ABC transporter permease [Hymenobacter aquaticus]
MDKIWLIIQREYLTRVRKKSFLVMTLLAPLIMAGFIVVPIMLAQISENKKVVAVADAGNIFAGELPNDPDSDIRYVPAASTDLATAKAAFRKSKQAALLYIPRYDVNNPTGFRIFARDNLSMPMQIAMERMLNRKIEAARMRQAGLDKDVLDKIKADVDLQTVNLSENGEKASSTGVTTGVAYAAAFLIYMFIFIYGVQIMRGVIEEKTNRIVEVVISSVKPFQLMMGKVMGIAAVGLTQLLLWIVLSTAVTSGLAGVFGAEKVVAARTGQLSAPATVDAAGAAGPAQVGTAATPTKKKESAAARFQQSFSAGLASLNLPLILGSFLFYFLGGYLFYGALFGAIGSAVDNETDTQQFMLPITMPLILTIIIAQSVIIRDPNGTVAFWMSMIPFTSPIAMMMRIPFGAVPGWQLLLSMSLLIAGFVFTIWLAGRIYRVGILMYGKKVNYRELSRWMFYKG